MSEHVIASVLRKLGPNGDVSHEEALGGQAIRENAVVYDSLVTGTTVRREPDGGNRPIACWSRHATFSASCRRPARTTT